MSSTRTAGQIARFTMSLHDSAGNDYGATAAAWELFDEDAVSLATGIVDLTGAVAAVTFSVPAAELTLAAGVPHAGREIVLTLTTPDGEIEVRDYFVLAASAPLVRFGNSILSYPGALAVREGFGPSLPAWDGATDQQRIGALIHAHANIARIAFTVPFDRGARQDTDFAAYGTGDDFVWDRSRRVSLNSMTAERWAQLPKTFTDAVSRATVVEADTLLGGDSIGDKRRDGIISETIGESSTFYQSKPILDLPISRRAYSILRRFINIEIGASR